MKSIKLSPSYILWAAVSGILSAISLQLEEIGGAAYESFHAFAKSKIVEVLNVVGWDSRATDGHTDKLLRATLVNLLDTFAYDDPSVVKEVRVSTSSLI